MWCMSFLFSVYAESFNLSVSFFEICLYPHAASMFHCATGTFRVIDFSFLSLFDCLQFKNAFAVALKNVSWCVKNAQ